MLNILTVNYNFVKHDILKMATQILTELEWIQNKNRAISVMMYKNPQFQGFIYYNPNHNIFKYNDIILMQWDPNVYIDLIYECEMNTLLMPYDIFKNKNKISTDSAWYEVLAHFKSLESDTLRLLQLS
jgi:hypothetical protein